MDTRDKTGFIQSVLERSASLRAELHRAADFDARQDAGSAGCLARSGGGAGTRIGAVALASRAGSPFRLPVNRSEKARGFIR